MVFSQVLIEVFSNAASLKAQLKVLRGYIDVYEKCEAKELTAVKYKISEYLDENYEDIDTYFLKKLTGLLGISGFSIDDTIQLYHVSIKGKNSANLICYTTPPLNSYIFMNSPPTDKNHPFQKFCLLHELGHACLHFASASAFSKHSNKLYLVYFFFLYFLLPWRTAPLFVNLALLLLVVMALIEKIAVLKNKQLHDEYCADIFAIGYMKPEDRKQLLAMFSKYPIKDVTFSNRQNFLRNKMMLENLHQIVNNEDEDGLENVFSKMFKPSFFLLIITCIAIAIPAFYSSLPSPVFALYLLILCIFLFGLFVFYHIVIRALHKHIASRLKKWRD